VVDNALYYWDSWAKSAPTVAVQAVRLAAVQIVAGRGLVQPAAGARLVRLALRGDLHGAGGAGPQRRGLPPPLPAARAGRRRVVLVRLRGLRPASRLVRAGVVITKSADVAMMSGRLSRCTCS
jgi:hypothetical protein